MLLRVDTSVQTLLLSHLACTLCSSSSPSVLLFCCHAIMQHSTTAQTHVGHTEWEHDGKGKQSATWNYFMSVYQNIANYDVYKKAFATVETGPVDKNIWNLSGIWIALSFAAFYTPSGKIYYDLFLKFDLCQHFQTKPNITFVLWKFTNSLLNDGKPVMQLNCSTGLLFHCKRMAMLTPKCDLAVIALLHLHSVCLEIRPHSSLHQYYNLSW